MTLRHRLAHILGWNRGTIVTQTYAGNIYVAFRCDGCGRVSRATLSNGCDGVPVGDLPDRWA